MKEKVGRIFEWGFGAFQIVMQNKIVSIGCFLVTGLYWTFSPVGSLRWDAGMLAVILAFYAVMSFILVLTNYNEKALKGRDLAGGFVQGYLDGKKNTAVQHQELFTKSKVVDKHTRVSNERLNKRIEQLSERQEKIRARSRTVLLILYAFLFALSVFLFIQRTVTVYIIHILFGLLLIFDGATGLISIIAAMRSGLPVKNKVVSLILSSVTLAVGLMYIVFSWNTAVVGIRVGGILLIVKAVIEYIIMIRNREVSLSVKDTLKEIKDRSIE